MSLICISSLTRDARQSSRIGCWIKAPGNHQPSLTGAAHYVLAAVHGQMDAGDERRVVRV